MPPCDPNTYISATPANLNIDLRVFRVLFDELPPRVDIFAHQRLEDHVCVDGILERHPEDGAR